MFGQIHSAISKFFKRESPALASRLSFLSSSRVEQLPANRIFVRSSLSREDLEDHLQCAKDKEEEGQQCSHLRLPKFKGNNINNHENHYEEPLESFKIIDGLFNQTQITRNLECDDWTMQDDTVVNRTTVEPLDNRDDNNTTNKTSHAKQKYYEDTRLLCYPTYLQSHFEVMYWIGMSPIRGDGSLGSPFRLGAFAFLSAIGIFHFLQESKQYITEEVETGNLKHYLIVWYFISALVVQTYMLKLFVFDYKWISKVLKLSAKNNTKRFQKYNEKLCRKTFISVLVMLIFSIAIGLRVDWMIRGYAIQDYILSRAYDVDHALFIWTKAGNQSDLFYEQYGSELTPTTVAMGTFGIAVNIVGNLKGSLTRDILLMPAFHTFRLSQLYETYVMNVMMERPNTNTLTKLREMHKAALRQSNLLDTVFGNFFKLVHIESWLISADFLVDILRGNLSVYFVSCLIYVPKILMAYCVSAKAINKALSTKYLIDNGYSQKGLQGIDKSDVLLFLKALEEQPIGVGRGQFLLDDSFASKFVGVVISCFLLFENLDKEQPCHSKLQ